MKTNITNKKTFIRSAVTLMLALCIVCSIAQPALAASTKPNVKYTTTNPVGVKTYMGTYKPGTLLISTSRVSSVGDNILDSLSIVCRVVKKLPGCSFVQLADWYVSVKPDVRYQVWLYDAGNGKLVWNGYLNSGHDMYLGNDHPDGYKVYIAATRLADCFTFVGLVPKK